jgi:hypothetical protein
MFRYQKTSDPDHERPPCKLNKACAAQENTTAFTSQDKFRNYASARCGRWNSVMQLLEASNNYAAFSVPFQALVPTTLALDARRRNQIRGMGHAHSEQTSWRVCQDWR